MQKLDKLWELFSGENNHSNYRELLHRARPPCVPFLGLLLRDLTEVEHTQEDYIDGLINFEKRIKMGKALMKVKQFQAVNFRFEPKNDLLWQVVHIPKEDHALSSRFLTLSRTIEPDDPEKMVEELLMKDKAFVFRSLFTFPNTIL